MQSKDTCLNGGLNLLVRHVAHLPYLVVRRNLLSCPVDVVSGRLYAVTDEDCVIPYKVQQISKQSYASFDDCICSANDPGSPGRAFSQPSKYQTN